jgi:uncharacterized protein YdeI (YjbR/CyaY-like superfamily)
MSTINDDPILLFASQLAWEEWLHENHTQQEGVWLQIAKKGSGIASVTYAEALECALCYGWIDGQKRSYDAMFFLQRFTPRRAKSIWSKVNTEKVTQLIAAGKMQPAGLKAIEAARQDGRWDAAYDSQSRSAVPEDFQAELDKNPQARDFFATLNNVNRYAIYFRLQNAKKPETRQARIQQFIAMLAEHKTFYP